MEKVNVINNSYHDKEVIGMLYNKEDKKLTLFFTPKEELDFNEIVQFELNFFSDQNILFDIIEYSLDNSPNFLFEDYPFLKNYRQSNKNSLFIYHLSSSVGISGIIINKERIRKR